MPISIKLKEKTSISLDGVNSEEYPKGKSMTSKSALQKRIFEHLVEADKAELVVGDESDKKEGKKVSKPKETKSSKKKSKKD